MLINHFKVALRNIKKQGVRSIIHVLGLSIGIAACMIVYNLVSYEYSFDTFHTDKEKIFRVTTITGNGMDEWPNPGIPMPILEVVQDEMPSVELAAPVHVPYNILVASTNQSTNFGKSNKVVFTTSDYFKIFKYDWLVGSKIDALNEPNSLVLRKSSAQKYFGDISLERVIGQELVYADSLIVTVKGIVADFTMPSDMIFNDFISFSTLSTQPNIRKAKHFDDWETVNSGSQLYIKLKSATIQETQTELNNINKKYIPKEDNWSTSFGLEPLSEQHFSQNFAGHTADKTTLNGLIFIGIFILLIACINFINLETAQAKIRAKEVGVRKTLGSSKKQLIGQFLTETFLIICAAILLSIFLAQFAMYYFKGVIPANFTLSFFNLETSIFLFLLSIIILVLSGLYPATILASYSPSEAFSTQQKTVSKFNFQYFLRKNLTVFQFGSSIAFIIIILAINVQLDYFMNKDVGFNKEAVLYINTPFSEGIEKSKVLKSSLKNISGIQEVSMSSDMLISGSLWTTTVEVENDGVKEEVEIQIKNADEDYLSIYNVPLLAGRSFRNIESEVVINESAVKQLGFITAASAIGKEVLYDEPVNIVGVIPDIHTQSMRNKIRPMMIKYHPTNLYTLNIKLNKNVNIVSTVASMNDIFRSVYPDEIQEFKFLDDTVNNFYQSEMRMRKVLFFATVLAILISCLGLFGLASFTISQRLKEISIRKILGASIANILILISKEYALLIGIAFLLAIFPAWYYIQHWLQNYEYKITPPLYIYWASGLIAFAIAIGIVSLYSLNVALTNPATILKDE